MFPKSRRQGGGAVRDGRLESERLRPSNHQGVRFVEGRVVGRFVQRVASVERIDGWIVEDVQRVGGPAGGIHAIENAGIVGVEQIVARGKIKRDGRSVASREGDEISVRSFVVRLPEINVDGLRCI